MKSKLFLTVVVIAATCTFSRMNAQQMCGQAEVLQKMIEKDPTLIGKMEEYQKYQAEFAKKYQASKMAAADTTKYIIPIVFHILSEYGSENIPDANIYDQVRILNRDYPKHNADTISVQSPFDKIIGKCNFEFRLAKLDPNGKPTNGIDRIVSYQTNVGGDAAKLNQWPRDRYLNVWVVAAINNSVTGISAAGYAQFPSAVTGFSYPLDGVMILYSYIGSLSPSAIINSRALTHEIGHFLSLQHTWGSSNSPEVACGDDGINDTPITKGHQIGSTGCTQPNDIFCSNVAASRFYTFNSVTDSSGAIDVSTPQAPIKNIAGDTLLMLSNFKAHGVSANSTLSNKFAFNKWGTGGIDSGLVYANMTGSIDLNKYYEFTFTPTYARAFNYTLSFDFSRNGRGVRSLSVRTSLDGFASNAKITYSNGALIGTQAGNVTFSKLDTAMTFAGCTVSTPITALNVPLDINKAVTVRFYGWDAEDSTGTFGIDNVSLALNAGINENVENYMEYAYCQKMFTYDQQVAMYAALNSPVSGRNNLWSESNLKKTGVRDTVPGNTVPKADFHIYSGLKTTIEEMACTGTGLGFTDDSWNVDTLHPITSRQWTFTNGTPATSTAAFVSSVTFSTPGWQSVKLVVKNSIGGSDSITKQVYISQAGTSQYSGQFSEGFENQSEFNSDWIVNNDVVSVNNTSKWQITNTASYSGSHSIMLNADYIQNVNYPFSGNSDDIDEFITPSVDLSSTSPAYLGFRYSYATKAFKGLDVQEKFIIYYSTNCGKSWSIDTSLTPIANTYDGSGNLTAGGNPAFANAGSQTGPYTPNSTSLWRTVVKKLPASNLVNNIRFKFQYTSSDNSNNMFIDDINISSQPLGVNDVTAELNSLNVFPNPANETATIVYQIASKENVDLSLYDMLGNKVMSIVSQSQEKGDYSFRINKQNLTNGMYFIRLTVGDKQSSVKKFVLQD